MTIDPISLGATLYIPATRDDLRRAIIDKPHPELRSCVICLEDSIRPDQAMFALEQLARLVAQLRDKEGWPRVFVRPRDPAMLARILTMTGIEDVDGFVIPKATAETLPGWLGTLAFDHHLLMPTLETREVFDPLEMRRLREQLVAVHERVLAIRIGGNDLLQTMGARRSAVRTAYDGPLGQVIANLVATFRPWGFALSAPVFEHFGNAALLREEVERDLEHGLLTKTAIHPLQISVIQSRYAVEEADLSEARAMLAGDASAVFASQRAMCEPATHRLWAGSIVARASHFGVSRSAMSVLTA